MASVSRSGLQGSCKMLGGVGGLCIKEADCPAVIEGRFLIKSSAFLWEGFVGILNWNLQFEMEFAEVGLSRWIGPLFD